MVLERGMTWEAVSPHLCMSSSTPMQHTQAHTPLYQVVSVALLHNVCGTGELGQWSVWAGPGSGLAVGHMSVPSRPRLSTDQPYTHLTNLYKQSSAQSAAHMATYTQTLTSTQRCRPAGSKKQSLSSLFPSILDSHLWVSKASCKYCQPLWRLCFSFFWHRLNHRTCVFVCHTRKQGLNLCEGRKEKLKC